MRRCNTCIYYCKFTKTSAEIEICDKCHSIVMNKYEFKRMLEFYYFARTNRFGLLEFNVSLSQ